MFPFKGSSNIPQTFPSSDAPLGDWGHCAQTLPSGSGPVSLLNLSAQIYTCLAVHKACLDHHYTIINFIEITVQRFMQYYELTPDELEWPWPRFDTFAN